jgi:hypothetical protein
MPRAERRGGLQLKNQLNIGIQGKLLCASNERNQEKIKKKKKKTLMHQ